MSHSLLRFASFLALASLLTSGSASATITGVDAGTILTTAGSVASGGTLRVRDIGSDGSLPILDDDTDYFLTDGYRGIAAYSGNGTADNGTIVTVGGGNLLLLDLSTDTSVVLDNDRSWSGGGLQPGIAAYTGDGTADDGTIVYVDAANDELRLWNLATDTSVLLDSDFSWEEQGIAQYTGNGSQDNGTILITNPNGLLVQRNLASNTFTVMDDEFNWAPDETVPFVGTFPRPRGIATFAVPEPGAALLWLSGLGLVGLVSRRSRRSRGLVRRSLD